MPLFLVMNIHRIFRAKGLFLQVRVYNLPSGATVDFRIFTTTFGRRGQPSDHHHYLRASWPTFRSSPLPSGAAADLRDFAATFGCRG